MKVLRRAVRAGLRALGYDVHPIPKRHYYHVNDYADMRFILNKVESPVIFDIGANQGRTADLFLKLFPQASLTAIEANPELAEMLTAKYQGDARVTVAGYALSDRHGSAEFHVNRGEQFGMSSLFPWKDNSENVGRVEKVIHAETIRLDDFCSQRAIETIDILKMDIQGAELLALTGARNLLSRGRIKLIYLEVWFDDKDYKGQCHFIDVYQLMRSNDYVMYGIYNTTQHEYTPNQPLIAGDAIFLHRSVVVNLDTTLTHVTQGGKPTPLNVV